MHEELEKLVGGDRRSIGRVDEVVADVMHDPALFGVVFDGMLSGDSLLRMRCADAAEKITEKQPGVLQPHKEKLIKEVAKIEQPEVRWHVAQMIPRLEVDREERAALYELLLGFLYDVSSRVKACSMQALVDLAEKDVSLLPQTMLLMEALTKTGSPAMQNKGRILRWKLQVISLHSRR